MERAPSNLFPPKTANPPKAGLAVASLVLAILGLLTSPFLVGAFLALVGLLLGVAHLFIRREARGMAWGGVGLSAAGILATVGFAALYFLGAQRAVQATSQEGGLAVGDGLQEWVGKPAPELELEAIDGTHWRLSELRGRRVVVDVWATWCPPCVKEVPHFVRLRQVLSTNDVVLLGVSREDRAVLKPFAAAAGVNYPIFSAARAELPEPFGSVRALPTTFFIDRQGRIQQAVVGYHDFEALRAAATAPDLEAPVPDSARPQ